MKLLVVITLTITLSHVGVHSATRVRRQGAPTLPDEAKAVILNHHNFLRVLEGAADMELMSWDEALAEEARKWLTKCDPSNKQMGKVEGEHPGFNVFTTKGNRVDFIYAIQSWFDEKYLYDYSDEKCSAQTKEGCKQYLLMVNSQTRLIGCAYHSCSGSTNSTPGASTHFVCNYLPMNAAGKQYQLGRACSKCSTGAGWCMNELCNRACTKPGISPVGEECRCNAICYNCGTLDEKTCKCSCPESWSGPDCSQPCRDNKDCEAREAKDCEGSPSLASFCPVMCGKCKPVKPASSNGTTDHCAPIFAGEFGGAIVQQPGGDIAIEDIDDLDLESDDASQCQYQQLVLYAMLVVTHYYIDSLPTLQ